MARLRESCPAHEINAAGAQQVEKSLHPAVWLVPAAMLLLAVAPLPYGYYTLLRLIVCGSCAYLALTHHGREGFSPWVCALAAVALLFNPIVPVHLSKEVWVPIDLAAASFIALHWLKRGRTALRPPQKN